MIGYSNYKSNKRLLKCVTLTKSVSNVIWS